MLHLPVMLLLLLLLAWLRRLNAETGRAEVSQHQSQRRCRRVGRVTTSHPCQPQTTNWAYITLLTHLENLQNSWNFVKMENVWNFTFQLDFLV